MRMSLVRRQRELSTSRTRSIGMDQQPLFADLATLITTLEEHFRSTEPHYQEHFYGRHRREKSTWMQRLAAYCTLRVVFSDFSVSF